MCIDAATGKVLWKVTWRGEGLMLFDHKCCLTNHTPATDDGVVYVMGALGIVRAVDCATGKVLWSKPVPSFYKIMAKKKQQYLDDRRISIRSRQFGQGVVLTSAAVIAPKSPAGGGCGGPGPQDRRRSVAGG